MNPSIAVALIGMMGLIMVALVKGWFDWRAEAVAAKERAAATMAAIKLNDEKTDQVKGLVDGSYSILSRDLAMQTAKANYLQGIVDNWTRIENRNDLLAATPPPLRQQQTLAPAEAPATTAEVKGHNE